MNGTGKEQDISAKSVPLDLSKEVGRLIEARKAYKGNKPIFERFNILVSLLRVWRDERDARQRLEVSKRINRTRAELADLGVQV